MFDLAAATLPQLVAAVVVALAIAAALGVLVVVVLRRLERRWNLRILAGRLWQSPVVAVVMLAAVGPVVQEIDRRWAVGLAQVLLIAQICAVAWLAVVLVRTAAKGALARYPDTGLRDERSRHVRTKIALIERVAIAAVGTLAVGAILWTFPSVRAVGVTLLASAGVLSIIAGLAAQTILANVFAGIQIAFTDGIRVGDVVVIEGRQGRIEEITLTYVAVEVWNETTLILPCTYFITTPFENWSHSGDTAIGEVQLVGAWEVPVIATRQELRRVVGASPFWDGRVAELRVGDTTADGVVLLAQFSAASDTVELLRFEVREALTDFLASRHPDALPRVRQEHIDIEATAEKGST
ncbi:mechanosensitive ion channel family protein [Agromyces arachidis]|uniref:mechanosensitive ion channel family protein n=1 Tax=Agromyces arachidis TaxID=766966 RepID=UPI0040568AB2